MSAPLDPAEIDRVLKARTAAWDAADAVMERLRHREISIGEAVALERQIVWPRWPRHTLGPCMPGCEVTHSEDDATEDMVSHLAEVAEVPTMVSGRLAAVSYGFVDDLVEGTRGAVRVIVEVPDGLTPDSARVLAGHLVRAAARAEHWNFLQQQGGTR